MEWIQNPNQYKSVEEAILGMSGQTELELLSRLTAYMASRKQPGRFSSPLKIKSPSKLLGTMTWMGLPPRPS